MELRRRWAVVRLEVEMGRGKRGIEYERGSGGEGGGMRGVWQEMTWRNTVVVQMDFCSVLCVFAYHSILSWDVRSQRTEVTVHSIDESLELLSIRHAQARCPQNRSAFSPFLQVTSLENVQSDPFKTQNSASRHGPPWLGPTEPASDLWCTVIVSIFLIISQISFPLLPSLSIYDEWSFLLPMAPLIPGAGRIKISNLSGEETTFRSMLSMTFWTIQYYLRTPSLWICVIFSVWKLTFSCIEFDQVIPFCYVRLCAHPCNILENSRYGLAEGDVMMTVFPERRNTENLSW